MKTLLLTICSLAFTGCSVTTKDGTNVTVSKEAAQFALDAYQATRSPKNPSNVAP